MNVKKKNSVVAIFDLSSSSVGGAHSIFPFSKENTKEKIAVLAHHRSNLDVLTVIPEETYIKKLFRGLQETIEILKKADHHTPSYIQIVLSSPWFSAQTRQLMYKKDAPFICTKELLKSLTEKEVEHVISKEFSQFGIENDHGSIIEKQITQIKLNGYPTADPFGKKAHQLEVSILITVSLTYLIKEIRHILDRHYPHISVGFTTSPYANHITVRDYFQGLPDGVIVDIGEAITDIAFIKENMFLSHYSFPVGTSSLYSSIGEGVPFSYAEANALIETYRLGKMSEQESQKIEKLLFVFGNSWQEQLRKALSVSSVLLPVTLYLVGDTRFSTFFSQIITKDPFIQTLIQHTNKRIIFIGKQEYATYIYSIDQDDADESLGAGILFVDQLLKNKIF